MLSTNTSHKRIIKETNLRQNVWAIKLLFLHSSIYTIIFSWKANRQNNLWFCLLVSDENRCGYNLLAPSSLWPTGNRCQSEKGLDKLFIACLLGGVVMVQCFFFCGSSVLLTCGKRLVGVLPSLVNHGQDKELHVRLAALQVWTNNYTCPKISEFWFSAEPVL